MHHWFDSRPIHFLSVECPRSVIRFPDSHVTPLAVLPADYSIPLYWTPAELQTLNVSPVFAKAMTGWRMAAKQYVYLVHLLRSAPNGLGLPASCGAAVLPFDVYRWAFAATITRQVSTASGLESNRVSAVFKML